MAGRTWRPPPLEQPKVDFTTGGEGGLVVQCSGLQALEDNLRQLGPTFVDAAGFELSNIMEDIITDAQANYVPVLTEALRKSAGWDEYKPRKGMTLTEIGGWFGAPTEVTHSNISRRAQKVAGEQGLNVTKDPHDYAVDQHENPNYEHTTINGAGPNVGWKYLERPFLKAEPTIIPRIAAAIDRAIGGGFSGFAATLSDDEGPIRGIGGSSNSLDSIADALSQRNTYPGYGPGHE